jgi:hypothetical protein
MFENGIAVIFEVSLLAFGECADIHPQVKLPFAHDVRFQSRTSQNNSVSFEGKVSAIKEMVDVWRKQQTVGAVKSLCIIRMTPRFYVACSKVSLVIDSTETANTF